ncbi:MAG: PaaI family thioesterase [Thermoguttaceae bacterium]
MQDSAYQQLRDNAHPNCFLCAPSNPRGLGLVFQIGDDGGVEATFACDDVFQSYPSTVHGGIVSSLLDSAMTNCLFAHGHVAVTFELNIRFRHPVETGSPATVRARITASSKPIHELTGEVLQQGQVKATAKAKFLEKTAGGWF